MDPAEVEKLIKAGLPDCEVIVKGDGSHFDAIVIGEVFAGQPLVKQQQLVYATVVDRITNGQLHALSIKTYTPQDWERAKKLQVSP
jgi:acid stress-induced BolA-like protein IbaG/YrbA